MDTKKILALTLIVLELFSCMSVASAGWFDWFGGSKELQNQTYTIEGMKVDLPENATMFNISSTSNGVYSNTYYISWGNASDGNNGSIDIGYATGSNLVRSADEFIQNWADLGAKSEGSYKDWVIINRDGVPYSSGSGSYSGYILGNYRNGSMYLLMGDNLTFLKSVIDTISF